MKLKDWAQKRGISYRTAWNWFRAGKLPVKAIQTETGMILVEDELEKKYCPTCGQEVKGAACLKQ